jgi:hypothetical protein
VEGLRDDRIDALSRVVWGCCDRVQQSRGGGLVQDK